MARRWGLPCSSTLPTIRAMRPDAPGVDFGRPIRVGRNGWIGGGAIILPGVTIGDDALFGAGAVATRDVPAGATAVGNPARVRAPRRAADEAPTD